MPFFFSHPTHNVDLSTELAGQPARSCMNACFFGLISWLCIQQKLSAVPSIKFPSQNLRAKKRIFVLQKSPAHVCWDTRMFWVGLCPLKQEIESRAEWKGVQNNSNKWVFTVKPFVTLFSSCGSQWPEVANVWHVPSIRWNNHDWAPSEWQEEEVHDQVKEQQLGSQIQWNLSLVSVKNSLGVWRGKCRCKKTDKSFPVSMNSLLRAQKSTWTSS